MELILPILGFISGCIVGVISCVDFQAKELARKEKEWFNKGYRKCLMNYFDKNEEKERRLRRVK